MGVHGIGDELTDTATATATTAITVHDHKSIDNRLIAEAGLVAELVEHDDVFVFGPIDHGLHATGRGPGGDEAVDQCHLPIAIGGTVLGENAGECRGAAGRVTQIAHGTGTVDVRQRAIACIGIGELGVEGRFDEVEVTNGAGRAVGAGKRRGCGNGVAILALVNVGRR